MPESDDTANGIGGQPMPMIESFHETRGGGRLRSADARTSVPTMTSQEIADLVTARHDNVRRAIERLAERRVIALPPMEEKPTLGRPTILYVFSGDQGKRDSIVVMAQLSPEFTARLVDRWQELEAAAASVAFRVPQSLPEALRLAADNAERADRAEAQLQLAAPKVSAYDLIASTDGSFTSTEVAKTLGQPPRKFQSWLRMNRWTYRRVGTADDVAYQDKLDAGLLCHKTQVVNRADGSEKVITRARVTPKGLARLAKIFGVEQRSVA